MTDKFDTAESTQAGLVCKGYACFRARERNRPEMKSKYWPLIRYAFLVWRPLSVILVLTASSSILAALQPWPLKVLVDSGLRNGPLPASWQFVLDGLGLPVSAALVVTSAAVASLGLFALNSGVDAGLTLGWAAAGQRMVFKLTADLFHRLQRLSLLFHSRRTVGDSLSRLTVDTWSIYSLTSGLLITPIQQILLLITVGVVAFQLDRTLALTSLTMAPMLALSSIYFGRRMKRRAVGARESHSRLTSFVHQALSSIAVVQCFGTESRNRTRYVDLAEEVSRWSQKGVLIGGSYGMVNGLITTAGMGFILFAGSQRVLAGELSLGTLLLFLAYAKSMQQASQSLLQIYSSLKPVEASIDRLLEILDTPEIVRDAPHAKALPRRSPEEAWIRFEAVTFGYEQRRPVLRDINIEARPGETVALVGATGAGKSTLISLVPRFFDPWSGRVTFNGTDLKEIRLADVRERISVMLQEPFLSPLTVAENIAYGRPHASRLEIVAAAEAANADEFIRHLPNGYDTEIGERGARLSGGQRQRIAIARALLKSAPVLILDEPTSALDAVTEALLLDALDRLMVGRTVFVIAHRLSTVRRAHRIIVMDRGVIAESGTHDELLTSGGIYHRLHSLQFREPPSGKPV